MTDILLINPNTTASITDLVLKTAKRLGVPAGMHVSSGKAAA